MLLRLASNVSFIMFWMNSMCICVDVFSVFFEKNSSLLCHRSFTLCPGMEPSNCNKSLNRDSLHLLAVAIALPSADRFKSNESHARFLSTGTFLDFDKSRCVDTSSG